MFATSKVSFCRQPSSPREASSEAVSNKASDKELVRAIADGNRYAMKLLYRRHSVRVYRFALRFLGDDAVAEEIVNEVFMDVWREAEAFEGRSQVSTWLLAITRHKAIAIARRRSLEISDDDAMQEIEETADNPEIAFQKKQRSSLLAQCLAKLSSAHREIIDLVYYHEKSIDEVAEIIHVPPNTVKTRMYYARNHLTKLLAKSGLTGDILLHA